MDKLFSVTVTLEVPFPVLAKDKKAAKQVAKEYFEEEMRNLSFVEDYIAGIESTEIETLEAVPKEFLGTTVYNEIGDLTPEEYFAGIEEMKNQGD